MAWHMAYWARGGATFFLVKAPSLKSIYLFEGDKGPSLHDHGLSGTAGHRFEGFGSMFEALRPLAQR